MRCPFCSAEKNYLNVIDSRTCEGGRAIRRRRKCEVCSKRFTTYERVEQTTRLMVIKKDGKRVPWDKERIVAGLERACFKRPVPETELLRLADEVEEEVRAAYDREVPSTAVGELVIEKLRRLDQVAYVRFASVYREFKTLEELVDEARAVIDSRRYEDPPGQGRLFIEPQVQPRPAAVTAPKPTGKDDRTNGDTDGRARGRGRRPAKAPDVADADVAKADVAKAED